MASEHQSGGHRSADDIEVGRTGARFGGAAGRRRWADPEEEEEEETTRRHRGDRTGVGESGARLSPARKRWLQKQEDSGPPEATPANLDDSAPVPHRDQPVPRPETTSPEAEPSWVDVTEWVDWPDGEAVQDSDGLVRPYFWTGGRTASRFELSFETLISAVGRSVDPTAPPEHQTILKLCGAPRSVAEIAALMSMPLGVARVVLGDMAEAGSVAVHRTVGSADFAPDLALMQRVLNGLQRL